MDFFEQIYNLFVSVPDFFIIISFFLDYGIIDFSKAALDYIQESFICLYLKLVLLMLNFYWDILKALIIDLNISGKLATSFGGFDNNIVNTILFFRIPEAIDMILAGLITRFVLRLIPFM